MRRLLLPAATAAAAIFSTTCGDTTGPDRHASGAVAIAPNFGSLNLDLVEIAKGRFLLTRVPGGAVALDTIITISPGQDSVSLALTVPIITPDEQFSLFISLISSQDDTLFQAGPLTVTPSTSGSPVPVPADFVYVGTGANAAGVRIVTPDTSVFFGETVTEVGEAFDSSDVAIPSTPIGWTSLDTLIAQVTTDASYHGVATGGSQRGTARLVATLITGQTDTVLVSAQPVPSDILAESGDGQSARADSVLAQPLVARVVGADALGIAGVWVHFTLTAGNGTLSADSVRTGPDGRASVEYTMARSFASHLIAATTARLPADTATFTAQLRSEPPDSIAIVAGDGQTATAGAAVAVAPQVRVLDANGQVVAGATVTFNVTAGGGIVAGGTPVTDTLGLAAATSWTLGNAAGTNTLRAFVVEGLDTLAVTFTATAAAGPATQLVLVSGDAQTDTAGATLPLPLVVRAEDANGNAVSGAQVDWAAGTGSLSASTTATDAGGLAQVTWTLGTTAGAQAATATLNGTTASVGFTSTATAGTAARLGFTVEPTDVQADSVITPAVAVTAFDTFDNVVTGFTGNVQVTLLANPTGGTLSGTTTAAAVAGIATFADLRVDLFGSGYTLLASATGLTPDTSATFDVLPPAGVAYWANASGGNWSDPANWMGGAVPATTDTVMVDLAGSYTISLDTTVTVARVLLGDGSNTPTLTYASRPFGTSDGFFIAAGATAQISNGTLDGPGTVTVASGATLVSARSTINADLVNQGTLELQGNPQAMNGALTQTGTLQLTSDTFGNGGLLTVASGFTNSGAIQLTGTNEARITVASGTLTNAASGTITSLGTYQRTLATPVDNQGTIDIQGSGGLTLNAASAQHANSGTITLSGGDLTVTQSGTTPSFTTTGTLTVGAGRTLAVNGGTFTHQAGALGGTGTIALSAAATGAFTPDFTVDTLGLTLTNATVNGPGTVTVAGGATLVSARSTINADLVNQGTLELQGNPQAMNGALTQSGTMRLTSDPFGNGGLLTMASGFTNSGAMELSGTNEARITITSGTLTNAASGTITTLGTYGRTLATPVDNQGTIDVQGSGGLELNAASAQHTNSGTITLSSGNLTVPQSGTTPSFTHSAGTIEVGAGQTFGVTGGSFAFTGGTLQGDGTADLAETSVTTLDGAFAPGTSPGLLTLNLPAGVALGTNAAVTIELGADPTANLPGVDNDLLSATNQLLALGGALDVTLINGYVPAGTETWPLIAGVSGSFAQVTLPPLDYSWTVFVQNDTLFLGPPSQPAGSPTWTGAVSTDWFNAGNWDGGVVPNSDTTDVVVPAGPSQMPLLSATVAVRDLLVEAGATVTVNTGDTLFVRGNLDAGSSIVGPGMVLKSGDGTTIQGTVANLTVTDSVLMTGPLTVTNDLFLRLFVQDGTPNVLEIEGFPLTVGGNVSDGDAGDASIRMDGVNDSVDVAGDFIANGDTFNRLTAGVLRIGGNFSQGFDGNAFAPTGSHRVVLDGATPQTVAFNDPANARFQYLEIAAGTDVTFTTNALVAVTFTVAPGAAVTLDASAVVQVNGNLAAASAITGPGRINKRGVTTIAATSISNLFVSDSVRLAAPLTVTGDLSILPAGVTSNVLDLDGFALTVNGSLTNGSGGDAGLRMDQARDSVDVAGDFISNGETVSRLTAGVLRVGGNFTQGFDGNAFAPSGTHRVVLDGTGPQTVTFNNPGAAGFQDVDFANASGVTLATDVVAAGNVSVPTSGVLDVVGTLTVGSGGSFTLAGGALLSGTGTLDVSATGAAAIDGDLAPGAAGTAGTFTITGKFQQSIGSTVFLELGGPGASDRLVVSDTALVAGTVDVSALLAGYTPVAGDTIPVAIVGQGTGEPAITLPTAPPGLTVDAYPVDAVSPIPDTLYVAFSAVLANLNTWTGGAGDGLWSSAGNWSKNVAPAAGDSVVIDLAGTYTVTIPSPEAPQVAQLFLGGAGANPTLEIAGFATLVVDDTASVAAGATLQLDNTARFDGAAILSVEGTLTCPGGNCIMSGAGLTEIAGGGTFVIDGTGGSGLSLETRNLVNRGTTNWQGASSIASSGGATVLNAPGGVFNVSTTGGATAPIVNQGTFVRAGNAFGTSFAGPFTTTGTVDIQNGALSFTEPTSWAGTVTVSSATANALDLAARAHAFADGLSITGPLSVTNGSPFATSVTVPPGATVTLDAVDLVGGTLEVDGYADVNGSFSKGPAAVLQGIGTLDLADPTIPAFDGPIDPGNSPGLLTIVTPAGGLSLAPTASVNIELAGTTRGTLYDGLEVAGGLALDGNATLNVDTTGFTPTVGDQFAVMTFASRSGTFGTVTLPTVAGVRLDTAWTSGRTPDTLYVVANAAAPPNLNSWTGGAGDGLWSSAANWSKNAVPTSADSVVIGLEGTYSVTLDQTADVAYLIVGGTSGTQTFVQSANTLKASDLITFGANSVFQFAGDTVGGPADITIDGTLLWSGGRVGYDGSDPALNIGGSATLTGGSLELNRDVSQSGSVDWLSGTMQFGVNAISWLVQSGATLSLGGAVSAAGPGNSALTVDGSVVKTGIDSASIQIDVVLVNPSGTFDVQGGVLSLLTRGNQGGPWNVAVGARVRASSFGSGLGWSGGLTGAGEFVVEGAGIRVASSYSLPSIVVTGSGNATFTGSISTTLDSIVTTNGTLTLSTPDSIRTRLLAISGGTVGGTAPVVVVDSLRWTGGTLGSAAPTILRNAALARLDGATKTLSGAGLNLAGTSSWPAGSITFLNGAPLTNSGLLERTGSTTADFVAGGGGGTFTNTGTFRKSGTGSTTIGVPFDNQGTIDLLDALTLTGDFTHATGAVLQGTGTLDLAGATVSAFDGTVRPGTSPGQLTINGAPTLGANAVVEMELAGSTTPGTDFDQLRVTNGPLTLGGTLNVTLIDPYVPAGGESWPLLTGVSGSFATVSLPPGLVADTVTRNDTLFLDAASGDPTNYWRFEGANFLLDSEGSADLTTAGTPVPAQVTLPATGRGSAFPDPVSAGANSSAADFSGGSGSSRFTTTLPLTQRFTIEAFVHFDTFTGTYGKIIAGFGPANDSPWNLQVRLDGILGTTPRELILGGGTTTTGQWAAGSGFILDPGIDYYVAAAFDIAGTVTFWIQDLTNGGPLQTSSTTHGLTVLPADTRFAIGENSDGTYDFEMDGLIDELRLSNRVLTQSELIVSTLPAPPPAILFAGDSAGGLSSGIFSVDGDGTNLKQVTTEGPPAETNVYPRWSPDRTRITYTARQPGDPNQLHIRSADGLTVAHLTSVSDTSTFKPRWSPDGKHLAFECGDGGYPNSDQDVCVVGDVTGTIGSLDGIADGNGKVYVTDAVDAQLGGSGAFAWNPKNPDQLAVVRDSVSGEAGSQIWLVNYDGTGVTKLTPGVVRINTDLVRIFSMDWSPDGTFIAVEGENFSTGEHAIFRVEVSDGSVSQLTTSNPSYEADYRPMVSPDNSQILYGYDTDGAFLMRVPSAGGQPVQVSPSLSFSVSEGSWDWSPDGSEIVHVTDAWSGGGLVIAKVKSTTTNGTYATDLQLVGRAAVAGNVQDRQPSWRP